MVAYYASKLPPMADWTVPPRAANVRILAANGALISNRGDSAGEALTLDEMPPYLPQAVIAIEDRRFYWHFGIDPIGLVRARSPTSRAGHVVEGGSTLTQQLAKNLFLKPERTFERKVQEVILAVWLQMRLSKKQILDALPEPRLSRRRRLWRRRRRAPLFRQVGARRDARRGGDARRHAEGAGALLAGHPPGGGGSAHADRARRHAGRRLHHRPRRRASPCRTPVTAVHDVAGGSGRYVADWVMDKLPQYVGGRSTRTSSSTPPSTSPCRRPPADAISETLAEGGAKYGVGQAALVAIDPDGAVKALVGGRDYRRARSTARSMPTASRARPSSRSST